MSGELRVGDLTIAPELALVAAGAIVLGLLLLAALVAWRSAANRAADAEALARETRRRAEDAARTQNAEMNERIAELVRAQGAINGQVQTMSQRLDGFGQRVGQSMSESAQRTHDGLSRLGERLAVIDKAQQTITSLSTQVVELQQTLANKQTRGAFGQARMEAIIRDQLPASGYSFQPTLSNNTRPDCLISFPEGTPDLVIDAKFPLEAWNLIRAAETPEAAKTAEAQFRRDTIKHIQDIAERYFVPGETQDTAFMFVPSESIFADIHERFEDIVQRAHRARVVIVSPSLLMLSIQVVMSLMRDARMREQAHLIQEEVMKVMEDVARLDDRVRKLQTHFVQASKDIEGILTSTRKVTSRGQKIQDVEVDDGEPAEIVRAVPRRRAAAATARTPTKTQRDPLPELPFSSVEEV